MSPVNDTNVTDTVRWTFITAGKVTIASISLVLNISMLLFFLADKRRITAFTVYLLCLLSSNILFLSCWAPLNVVSEVYTVWWMGQSACAFLNYMNFVFSGCVFHTHCLITINRIWAIRFPVSYRNHHNKRAAVAICLGIVSFNHVFSLPAYFIGLVQHRDRPVDRCGVFFDQQPFFARLQHIVVYEFSLFFVAGAYLYLYRKVRKQRLQRPLTREGSTAEESLSIDQGIRAIIRMTTLQVRHEELGPLQPPEGRVRPERNGYEAAKPFVVLTLSTASIVVCWTPVMVWWAVWLFVDSALLPPGFYHVAMLIYNLQAMLDPLWVVLSLRSVQTALRAWLPRCRKHVV